jgi:hypothetical protein
MLIYAAVHVIAFLATSPHLIAQFGRNARALAGVTVENKVFSIWNPFSADLWHRKSTLLFDEAFLGVSICIAFAVATLYLIGTSIARRRAEPVHILTVFIASYAGVFLIFWGDVFNISGGHRYLLQVASLMPIVVAAALYDLGERFGRFGRAMAAIVGVVILLVGAPPRSIDNSILSKRVHLLIREVDRFWNREETGRFQVRNWIERYVPAGSRIMTQAYLNIQLPGHIPGSLYEQGFRWRGHKDIKVFFDPSNTVYLTTRAVAEINPDFVFSVNRKEVDAIVEALPFRVVTVLGREAVVYVLAREGIIAERL